MLPNRKAKAKKTKTSAKATTRGAGNSPPDEWPADLLIETIEAILDRYKVGLDFLDQSERQATITSAIVLSRRRRGLAIKGEHLLAHAEAKLVLAQVEQIRLLWKTRRFRDAFPLVFQLAEALNDMNFQTFYASLVLQAKKTRARLRDTHTKTYGTAQERAEKYAKYQSDYDRLRELGHSKKAAREHTAKRFHVNPKTIQRNVTG